MHITHFEAENFKRLKAVRIDPDTNTVVIAGRNAQGKSSVLDGIQAALAGKAGAKQLKRPIRDGESKARVVIELEDLRIERKWTPSGSTLTVGPKDGAAKLNSPQAVLDKLIGVLSFDPLAFAEAEPKKQVETLIDLIGREQFEALAVARKEAYDTRTDTNRELKRIQAQLDALGSPENVARADAGQLSVELEAAIELEGARLQWQQLENEINDLRGKQAALAAAAQDVATKVNPRDSDVIRADIRRVDEINEQARAYRDWEVLSRTLDDARQSADSLSAKIAQIDENRSALIEQAELPVEGLAFDEEGVSYQGVPFEQASAAERLKVSTAMAMALNPELKVICIRDASLLDNDSKAALIEMAKAHDYQIWYEVVGTVVDASIGVIIEDGEVA